MPSPSPTPDATPNQAALTQQCARAEAALEAAHRRAAAELAGAREAEAAANAAREAAVTLTRTRALTLTPNPNPKPNPNQVVLAEGRALKPVLWFPGNGVAALVDSDLEQACDSEAQPHPPAPEANPSPKPPLHSCTLLQALLRRRGRSPPALSLTFALVRRGY